MTPDLPKGARIWDNQARLSLSKFTYAWLGLLVATSLASILFGKSHPPARAVLAGFVVSHVIVFTFPPLFRVTWRTGLIGLLHILCWGPGWIWIIMDRAGRIASPRYSVWSCILVVVLAISFAFDARDGFGYLKWRQATRNAPA